MNSRRSASILFGPLLVVACALLTIEFFENQRLSRKVAADSDTIRRFEAPAKAKAASHPITMVSSAEKLNRAAIESSILEAIHKRLWRNNRNDLSDYYKKIDPKDMPYALQVVDQNAMGQSRRIIRMDLLSRWAKEDPMATAAWLDSFPSNEALRTEKQMVGDIWSETDPKAALAFAGPTQQIFYNYALKAPTEAASEALALFTNGTDRGSAIEAASTAWFESDPQAALKWAMTLPEGNARLFGIRPLLTQLASVDPASVASYIATLPSGQGYAHIEEEFSRQWADSDPSAAAAWAASLPAGSGVGSEAIIQVARAWSEDDPKAAAIWLESLPIGPARDTATQSFVFGALNYDPAMAAQYAVKIGDENQRSDAISAVALRWLNADPPAATAWLSQIELPQRARQQIRAQFPSFGNSPQ